jgi:hypothetical protein
MKVKAVPRPFVGMIPLFIDKIVLQQQLPIKISGFLPDDLSFTHDCRPPPLRTSEAAWIAIPQEQAFSSFCPASSSFRF